MTYFLALTALFVIPSVALAADVETQPLNPRNRTFIIQSGRAAATVDFGFGQGPSGFAASAPALGASVGVVPGFNLGVSGISVTGDLSRMGGPTAFAAIQPVKGVRQLAFVASGTIPVGGGDGAVGAEVVMIQNINDPALLFVRPAVTWTPATEAVSFTVPVGVNIMTTTYGNVAVSTGFSATSDGDWGLPVALAYSHTVPSKSGEPLFDVRLSSGFSSVVSNGDANPNSAYAGVGATYFFGH